MGPDVVQLLQKNGADKMLLMQAANYNWHCQVQMPANDVANNRALCTKDNIDLKLLINCFNSMFNAHWPALCASAIHLDHRPLFCVCLFGPFKLKSKCRYRNLRAQKHTHKSLFIPLIVRVINGYNLWGQPIHLCLQLLFELFFSFSFFFLWNYKI